MPRPRNLSNPQHSAAFRQLLSEKNAEMIKLTRSIEPTIITTVRQSPHLLLKQLMTIDSPHPEFYSFNKHLNFYFYAEARGASLVHWGLLDMEIRVY